MTQSMSYDEDIRPITNYDARDTVRLSVVMAAYSGKRLVAEAIQSGMKPTPTASNLAAYLNVQKTEIRTSLVSNDLLADRFTADSNTQVVLSLRVGITFGTFDLLHIGHVSIIERSKAYCDHLIVGVSSDALNMTKKKSLPVYSEQERIRIIRALRYVDEVFLEESLELKRQYIEQFKADILVMGDDWLGRFDFCKDLCEVLYLPRTPNISTTMVKAEVFHLTSKMHSKPL